MTPIIYDRSESGLRPPGGDVRPYLFGDLGEIEHVTIHHTAGRRAPDKATAQALHRAYQDFHMSKGWGDIAYHFGVDDLGRFYRLRPHGAKGTHTALHNSRNIGIMFHGTYGARVGSDYVDNHLTEEQRASFKWLFQGGFVVLFGEREAGVKTIRGHREWPDNFTSCPGDNIARHLDWLKSSQTF